MTRSLAFALLLAVSSGCLQLTGPQPGCEARSSPPAFALCAVEFEWDESADRFVVVEVEAPDRAWADYALMIDTAGVHLSFNHDAGAHDPLMTANEPYPLGTAAFGDILPDQFLEFCRQDEPGTNVALRLSFGEGSWVGWRAGSLAVCES